MKPPTPMKIFLALVMLGLSARLVFAQSGATPNRERDVTIVNQGGQVLRELYAVPPGATDPGPDLLGSEMVADRVSFRIRFSARACLIEFIGLYVDGSEERRRQNICENRRVQFGDPNLPLREAQIVNETDMTLRQFFIQRAGMEDMGPERLGTTRIPGGQVETLRLGRSRECVFDALGVFDGGQEIRRSGINLCREARVVFGDPALPWRPITVSNRAGLTVREFYAKAAGRAAWGPDRLGTEIIHHGAEFAMSLRDTACSWDLRAIYEDNAEEVKLAVDICAGHQVLFDGSGAPRLEERSLVLVNRHGADIREVYLAPALDGNWGQDKLGEAALPREGRRDITLWMRGCQADLRIVFENRRGAEERMGLDLCKQKTLLLQPGWTTAATAPEAPAVSLGRVAGRLLIRNASAFPVVELYIYEAGAGTQAQPAHNPPLPGLTSAGPARLAGHRIPPGEERLLALPEGMGCRAGLTIILGDGAETQIPDIDFCTGEVLVVN